MCSVTTDFAAAAQAAGFYYHPGFFGWIKDDVFDDGGHRKIFNSAEEVCKYFDLVEIAH